MSDQNNLPSTEDIVAKNAIPYASEGLKGLVKGIFDMIKTALILSPIFLIVIIVVLALIGPSVGNIFSNIVSSL